MTMAEHEIEVIVQIAGEDVVAGRLWSHRRRNTESQTFSYNEGYLSLPEAYALDPALPLGTGQQQTPIGRAIFGAFSDCAPDRWGRRLIIRTEQVRVREEGGAPRSFGEADFLLGVRDDLRQGALRFRIPGTAQFLADEQHGVPHLVDLPRLLSAADHLERDEATAAELRLLLRGGSSLGGARPKAHVIDEAGRIAIAKFPSVSADEWDVMRWEYVALYLAHAAGISVPKTKLHVIDGKSVLVVHRFDRDGDRRIGYVSAMTMLEATDGDDGRSYLEIAAIIEDESLQARAELRELWRRIAFSILISNFDDHLRNHGFLRTSSAGWSLSPAFDLNPDPEGHRQLATAIDYEDREARIDTLMGVAGEFRLTDQDARAVLAEVAAATSAWRKVATRAGLGAAALGQMAPAFEHDQATRARQLGA
jgi:serine/threonine-protein kinase HipA